MAKFKAPPTDAEQSAALAALKARILAKMAGSSSIPGSAEFMAELQRRVDNAFDGGFVLALKTELLAALALVQGGKGPVTHDPVDLA